VWSLDFNVDLMCSILAQVRPGCASVDGESMGRVGERAM